MKKKEKLVSLQALRALAFVGVVLAHTDILYLGRWGVSIFFVLSGFLLLYNYYDSEMPLTAKFAALFSLKRIMKLYPLYICTLIILFPLSGYMYRSFFVNIKEFVIHFFLLQALSIDGEMISRFNGSAWYLSASMFIFPTIPFVISVIRKYKNRRIPIIVCVLGSVIQAILAKVMPMYAYRFPLSRMIDVIVGCNLGYLFITRKEEKDEDVRWKYTLFELVAILLTIISILVFFDYRLDLFGLFLPSTSLLVYFFAMRKGYITKALTNKVLVYVGDISPNGFLIHVVVIRYIIVLCEHLLHIELDKYTLFVSAFVLTIICSEMWNIIEKGITNRVIGLKRG